MVEDYEKEWEELYTHILRRLDVFTRSYFDAFFFFGIDDPDDPRTKNVKLQDMDLACLLWHIDDCKRFQVENEADIGYEDSAAGHDFYLTRVGAGAGFWDGDWPEEAGARLTAASKHYGSFATYIGDYGVVYTAHD
jgi:hypothetical protein